MAFFTLDDSFGKCEVIAFPKVKDASCLMTEAPGTVDPAQLEELGIAIVPEQAQEAEGEEKE